jgi:hypothetical protein
MFLSYAGDQQCRVCSNPGVRYARGLQQIDRVNTFKDREFDPMRSSLTVYSCSTGKPKFEGYGYCDIETHFELNVGLFGW